MGLLLAILVVLLIFSVPAWPYNAGWGYYPSGGLGLVLLILLIAPIFAEQLSDFLVAPQVEGALGFLAAVFGLGLVTALIG